MRRISATLAVLALGLAACGGDDDDAAEVPAPAAEAATDSDEPADEPAGDDAAESEMVDESASDDDNDAAVSGVSDDDEMADEGADDGDTIVAASLDDIPQACRDLMESFLKQIEPIVSPIDWDDATINDFETIAAEFDPIAERFDQETEANPECDDIELDDDENFALLIEFAEDRAPGTVGFMTFISEFAMAAGQTLAEDDAGEDASSDAAFTDCAGAIEWLQGLASEYDSIADVPLDDMMQIANVANVFASCTPEQLEVLEGPEIQDFLSGL